MDVFIKVEECGDDFASPVTSTVVSPLDDLGPGFDTGSSTDFGMNLFDDKKNYFDPLAPMAEPVTSFHLKKDYNPGYEPVVTNIRPAAVVTSAADDVSAYVVTSVSSQQYSPTSNTPQQSYPGMTILYEQKSVESSTSPTRKYLPQKAYSPTKSSDPNFTAADSNSGSTGKSFVPCKVCGDKASGYHYGVTSCEGCKGFFRRSIQKKIEYRCLRDEKCLVIRLNRNRCQFCRFKKCLDVGMSRDSVRYGRVPKRSRERLEEQQQRVVSSNQQQQLESEQLESSRELALYDLTLTVAQAHHANCAYTEMRTRGLVRKPAIFSLNEFQSGSSDTTPDSLEQQKIVMWQHFAASLTPSIQRVVEFAKKVPGFFDLTQDDQLLLIKKGFFEIWVVHASRLTSPSDTTITFCDGSFITRQQVELMFDYEFVLALFNFVTSLNSLELNDTEVALFSAIVLLTSERQGIYDHKSIDKLQERVMEALKVQVSKNRPGEPNAFPLLMMKLPELRSLGAKHAEHLEWFRANWLRLRLPPLFAEIFDIPKYEDAADGQPQQQQ